jgi:hypothetical protein
MSPTKTQRVNTGKSTDIGSFNMIILIEHIACLWN